MSDTSRAPIALDDSAQPPDDASASVIRRALDALGREDTDAFVALVHPEVEIETGRGVGRGRDGAIKWASKRYDHLIRRWEVDEIRELGDELLMVGRVQYKWRESGELGDEDTAAIGFELDDGLIRALRLYESLDDAQERATARRRGESDS